MIWYHHTIYGMIPWSLITWYDYTMWSWYHYDMILWSHDHMVPSYCDLMISWYHYIMILWFYYTMISWYHSCLGGLSHSMLTKQCFSKTKIPPRDGPTMHFFTRPARIYRNLVPIFPWSCIIYDRYVLVRQKLYPGCSSCYKKKCFIFLPKHII